MLTCTPALAADGASNAASELDSITVTGSETGGDTLPPVYAGGQVAPGGRIGILGEQDAFDVPFNVISYTSDFIENQQADTVGEVLENDASVQAFSGFGNFAERYYIRGFVLEGEDISYGGLYGVLPRQIVTANLAERVELFKGANAFANGVAPGGSGVGGAINIEPKRAPEEPLTRLTIGYDSDSFFDGALDAGRRFGPDNQFGVRVNVGHGEGDTAVNDEERQSSSGAIALDYRGERVRASLDLGYQKQVIDGGRSIVQLDSGLTDIPEPPDSDTNYAQPWVTSTLETTFGMLRGEFDLTENWTAYAAMGGNNTRESGQYMSPTVINLDGDATGSRLGVPYDAKAFASQGGVRGEFITGPVTHQVNAGYSNYYRKTSSAYTLSFPAFSTNIYAPENVAFPPTVFSDGDLDDPNVRSRTRGEGFAVSDTLGFVNDRILLTLGARYQDIEVKNYNYDGSFSDRFSDHRVSPVYGIVVKPLQFLSLYANHIEALQPGDSAPNTAANAGQSIGIARSEQNEVGAKFDFETIGGGISLFQIEQPSAFTDPGTNIYGYNGEQRNRGIELSLYGEPTTGVRLLSSATYLDTELTETPNGLNDGNEATGVPEYRLVLGGEWDIPRTNGVTALGRLIHTGSQYFDPANQLKLDSWTRLDLGVRYEMPVNDQKLTWRANIENVTDEDYWAYASEGYLTQGQPRTVMLSASLDF